MKIFSKFGKKEKLYILPMPTESCQVWRATADTGRSTRCKLVGLKNEEKVLAMLTEDDICRLASEELANKFNRLMDEGKHVLMKVAYLDWYNNVYISKDDYGYVVKSGELPIRATDVYMTAYSYTVRLNVDIGNTHVVLHTMPTRDVQLTTY